MKPRWVVVVEDNAAGAVAACGAFHSKDAAETKADRIEAAWSGPPIRAIVLDLDPGSVAVSQIVEYLR
jgi:hypothetical protein